MKVVKSGNCTILEMPHARVTLTSHPNDLIEIEVWPKKGQSAYVLLPQEVAEVMINEMQALMNVDHEIPDNVVPLFAPKKTGPLDA